MCFLILVNFWCSQTWWISDSLLIDPLGETSSLPLDKSQVLDIARKETNTRCKSSTMCLTNISPKIPLIELKLAHDCESICTQLNCIYHIASATALHMNQSKSHCIGTANGCIQWMYLIKSENSWIQSASYLFIIRCAIYSAIYLPPEFATGVLMCFHGRDTILPWSISRNLLKTDFRRKQIDVNCFFLSIMVVNKIMKHL